MTSEKIRASLLPYADWEVTHLGVIVEHRCILNAKSDRGKTRLVRLATILAYEDMKRISVWWRLKRKFWGLFNRYPKPARLF